MAKIVEDIVILKFSKIVKDNDADPAPAVTNEHLRTLEQVAQELAGEAVIVEIERT